MESLRRRSHPAKPLSFIRIILSKEPTRIELPESFIKNNGGNLLDRVTLKVPNGDSWQVDLIKSKGKFWLDNEWFEFAEHYDLQFGDLVMFKYEGFSIFRVFIFDPSACEIAYPKKRLLLAHEFAENKARSSLDSCKKLKLDDLKPCSSSDQETEVKINGECSSKRVKKVERKSALVEAQKERINLNDLKSCSSLDQDQENEIKITGEYSSKKIKELISKRALEAAKASFKSDKPFFMVYMYPHHIEGRTSVRIPVKFARENWRGFEKYQKCVLIHGCKTWETSTCHLALKMSGWKIFMKDTGVAASDICVFELVNKHENLLRVSIVRARAQ